MAKFIITKKVKKGSNHELYDWWWSFYHCGTELWYKGLVKDSGVPGINRGPDATYKAERMRLDKLQGKQFNFEEI